MSHFAKIENNIVTNVIVAEQEFINTLDGVWIQTSYNTRGGIHLNGGTPLRKNYAGIGDTYDSERDAFIAPNPASWILDEVTCLWQPLVAMPTDGKNYIWDELTTSWVEPALFTPVEVLP